MSAKRFVALLMIALVAACAAPGEAPEAYGPVVEVTPREGHEYEAMLLNMKDGVMELRMADGETRRLKTAEVRSLRFLVPPQEKEDDSFTRKDFERLQHLSFKDRDSELTKAEYEELTKLRERAPLLLPGWPKVKAIAAHGIVATEWRKNRLDDFIALLRNRLKAVTTDESARDDLLLLFFAYKRKGLMPTEMAGKLKEDIGLIGNQRIRLTMIEKLPDTLEEMRNRADKELRKGFKDR